jgi:hypothetical protein
VDAQMPPAQAHYPYNDFAEEIAAASLSVSSDRAHLYDIGVQLDHQRAIWGPRYPAVGLPFPRVPWIALALAPLLLLPHAVAFLLFTALSVLAALVALVALARWAHLPPLVGVTFVVAGLGSFSLLRTVLLGQYSAFALFSLTAGLLLLWRGYPGWAGLALVIQASVKPNVLVLVVLALLLQRCWRTLASLAGAGGVLALLSAVWFGPQVVITYPLLLRDFGFSEAVEQMQNWRGLFESTLALQGSALSALMALALLGMAAIVVWVWWPLQRAEDSGGNAEPGRGLPRRWAWRTGWPSPDLRWALTIFASMLFSTHLHFNDLLLWAVPAAIVLRRIYAPLPGGAFSAGERAGALAMIWIGYFVPLVAFFTQAWRPGLWFALAAMALLAWRIQREQGMAVGEWNLAISPRLQPPTPIRHPPT